MKKILLIIAFLLTLALGAVYYFIPSRLIIVDSVQIECNSDGGFRTLSENKKWTKWWPGETASSRDDKGTSIFIYKGDSFSISKISHNNFSIAIHHEKLSLPSELYIIPLANNTMGINWQSSISTNFNPFQRYALYRKAVSLKENMHDILSAIRDYLSKKDNVYGLPFKEDATKDSILLAYRTITQAYPNTSFVYAIINNLKLVSKESGADITGFPMLNITPENSNSYKVMVALPINKALKEKNGYFITRLIPGKFITAEVKGGDATINESLNNIQLYFQDYKRISMAIPFQYLVTDRSLEPDTLKWVTRIYAPVY
jgi:hypothetical protein